MNRTLRAERADECAFYHDIGANNTRLHAAAATATGQKRKRRMTLFAYSLHQQSADDTTRRLSGPFKEEGGGPIGNENIGQKNRSKALAMADREEGRGRLKKTRQ
ncbi:hypothetical protein MRX96_048705 [Rhipicephalus microplus]